MSVWYDDASMTLFVDDEGVAAALGALRDKAAAVLKVAVNSTARKGTRDMKQEVKDRYALTEKGEARVDQIYQKKQAKNADLVAEFGTKNSHLPLDYAYFQHTPTTVYKGMNVRWAPEHVRGRVLRGEAMRDLTAEGSKSKSFLAEFDNSMYGGNNHIGMVQRRIGSRSDHTITKRGYPRWTSLRTGKVEKTATKQRPSVAQMGAATWYRGGEEAAAAFLAAAVERRIQQVLDNAARRRSA